MYLFLSRILCAILSPLLQLNWWLIMKAAKKQAETLGVGQVFLIPPELMQQIQQTKDDDRTVN